MAERTQLRSTIYTNVVKDMEKVLRAMDTFGLSGDTEVGRLSSPLSRPPPADGTGQVHLQRAQTPGRYPHPREGSRNDPKRVSHLLFVCPSCHHWPPFRRHCIFPSFLSIVSSVPFFLSLGIHVPRLTIRFQSVGQSQYPEDLREAGRIPSQRLSRIVSGHVRCPHPLSSVL